MAAYQGTYWEQTFVLTGTDGAALDLTGYTFEADVRTSVDAEDELFTLTSGDGLDIVSEVDGTLKVSFTAARTLLCPVGKVFFDVHHLNASPGPVFLFRAALPVKKSVTR